MKILFDLLLLVLVFWAVSSWRFGEFSRVPGSIISFGLIFILSFFLLSFLRRDYMPKIPRDALDSLFSTLKSFCFSFGLAVVLTIFLVPAHPSRLTLGLFFLLGLLTISLFRYLYNRICARRLIREPFRILFAGAGEVGSKIATKLEKFFGSQIEILGFLDDEPKKIGYPILGKIDQFSEVCDRLQPSSLFISISNIEEARMLELMDRARARGLPVKIISDIFDVVAQKVTGGSMQKLPMVDIQDTPVRQLQYFFKRTFDLIGASIILSVLSPVLLISALLIKLESKGPVFYFATRQKNRDETFGMFKFRTMYVDECGNEGGLDHENQRRGTTVKDDPRITRVGRWLRRFSIDELPQLFNVLKGEMSLVGPRPPALPEVNDYEPWHRKRLDGWAGMTGLWQVSGRTNLDFEDMVLLDIYYLENWSILLDVKILLKTVPAVLSGRGVN